MNRNIIVKLLAGALAVAAALPLVADTETVDGITWTYTVSNGKASLGGGSSSSTAVPTSTSGAIAVPSMLGGNPVTSIGFSALFNCSGLTSVTIPDSVESIESCAFQGCSGLKGNLTIPNSVTSIGSHAFEGCLCLTNVTIPVSVTNVGDSAFFNCSGLKALTVPQCVCDKMGSVFSSMYPNTPPRQSIRSVVVLDGATHIGDYTFRDWAALVDVAIPTSVTNVGNYAFSGCSKLTNMTLCDGVVNIGNYAFYNCQGLTNVVIPKSTMSIGNHAFGCCNTMEKVCIPNGVTCIGESAFGACSGLKEVTVPQYVCTNRVSSIFPAAYSSITNVIIIDGVTSIGEYAFAHCVRLPSLTIPGSVTNIANFAFYDCTGLKRVSIPFECVVGRYDTFPSSAKITRYKPLQTVTFDFSDGREHAEAITVKYGLPYGNLPIPEDRAGFVFDGWMLDNDSISAEDTVVSTDDHVLTAKWIPNSYVLNFNANGGDGGETRMENCGTEIRVPIVTREGYTFTGWQPTPSETVPASNVTYTAQWKINQYTVAFDANGGGLGETALLKMDMTLDYGERIVAPAVTREGCTFEGWLPGVPETVPASNVTFKAQWKVWDVKIDSTSGSLAEMFPNDYGDITNVIISSGISEMPAWFFAGCKSLVSVSMVNGMTNVGECAFCGCAALRNLTIPDSVEYIGDGAFDGCVNIQCELWDGYKVLNGWLLGYTDEAKATIPDADRIRGIVSEALTGCTALKKLEFTEKSVLKSVGGGALKGCTELIRLVLPQSLESIGDEAFMGCSYLENVIVPGSVKSVGARAFKNCTGFTNAQIEHGVESLGEEAFYGCWRITEVDVPSSVKEIGVNAFGGDSSITKVSLRGDIRPLREIFSNIWYINNVIIKEGDHALVEYLFEACGSNLVSVQFIGNCPELVNGGENLFTQRPMNVTSYVSKDSTGWDGTPGSHQLPKLWPLSGEYRYPIAYGELESHGVGFDANGGMPKIQAAMQRSDSRFVFPAVPTRNDHVFLGWWTEPVGGVKVTEDTVFFNGVYETLYAHWNYVELSVNVDVSYTTEADGTIGTIGTDGTRAFDLGACVASLSEPKITVKGLPTGLKYDAKTGTISGKATKPGKYTVTVSATNATVKKPVTATFDIVVPNFTTEMFEVAGLVSDGKYVLWAGVAPDLADVIKTITDDGWKLAVSGLPSGIKYDAKNGVFTGVATKEGCYTVTFTAKRGSGKAAEKDVATATFEVVFPEVTLAVAAWDDESATNKVKVAGGGKYPFGKKVTLKAMPAKGNVFMGWYDDDGVLVGQSASYPYMTTDEDVTLTAVFITVDEDKAGVSLAVDGMEMEAAGAGRPPYQTNVMCGVYMEWPVAVEALSLPTVAVSGLPAGLKFTAKPVTSKVGSGKAAVVVTNVPANTIYGTPTAASKVDAKTGAVKPSAVKVTVTTAGKTKVAYEIDVTVDAVKEWAVGTFDGAAFSTGETPVVPGDAQQRVPPAGLVQAFTVSAAGKISGKLLEGDKTWTLSAANFDAYDAEAGIYTATVVGKSGKEAVTNEVTITEEEAAVAGRPPYQRGVVTGDGWTAWQNLWKAEPWKTDAKPFAKAPALTLHVVEGEVVAATSAALPSGTISLKFASSGAVTASGKFVTGQDARGKDVVYSASCSSMLIPTDGDAYAVYLYFPPKAGKFEGYAAEVSLVWGGAAFSLAE